MLELTIQRQGNFVVKQEEPETGEDSAQNSPAV